MEEFVKGKGDGDMIDRLAWIGGGIGNWNVMLS